MTLPILNDERLGELFGLMHGADSVELKLTVPETDLRSAVQSFGMNPLEAQIRQVVFFDTPDLVLNASGVVVRARRIQGGNGDTVVKLRPVTVEQLPDLRRFNTAAEARSRLAALGVNVDGEQQTKTRTALDYFAGLLNEPGALV